jgi:hypothetical protein
LIVTVSLLVPPVLLAEQVNVTPAVSLVMRWSVQPSAFVMYDSSSLTLQCTITSLVYQPLLPSVPVIEGVMMGAVV